MLPTTGFFKDIDCPYYTTSCKRPYCHFKHRKKKLETPTAAQDVPTYNPTPKSQLASNRSHIPISYVPDLVIRTERRNMTYGYAGGDKPTYNPTPLSILSTAKNTASCEENSDYTPTVITKKENVTTEPTDNENAVNDDDINFEDLETEFNMIDEIIGDSKEINGKVNNESSNKPRKPDEKVKCEQKTNLYDSGVSKNDAKISETSNGSSTSSSQNKKENKSHSSKSSSKSKSKESDKKESSRSSKSSSKDRKRSRSEERKKDHKSKSKDKKHESKDKHKESSKSSHKSRSKESRKEKKVEEKKQQKEEVKKEKLDEEKKEKRDEEKKNDSEEKVNESIYESSDDSDISDLDPLEECYKIFTEYKPTEPELFPDLRKEDKDQDDENFKSMPIINKKRIAHENADRGKQNIVFNKPKYIPSAAQTMVNRLKAARLAQASNEQNNIISEINRHIFKRPLESVSGTNNAKVQKTSIVTKAITSKPTTSTSLIDSIITGKLSNKPKRIAPVQNVDSIQRAKAKVQELAKLNAINATKTAPQTLRKGAQRTAHIPESSVTEVPDVLSAERSKLPVNVRTRYLTMMLDECVKLYIDTEEAQQRALNEEFKCYERCAVLVTYRNSAMLAINRLRKQLQEREVQGLGLIFPGELADISKSDPHDLQGQKFYNSIKHYILNNEELILHGFPREGKVPGRAVIKTQRHVSKGYLDENERTCCRCLKVYKVDNDGFALYKQECSYHPLKKRTFRGESMYLCCKSNEDYGCVTAATHVSETIISEDEEIEGYQTTMPPDGTNDPRSYAVYALDCEMCYTTKGLELTRVTIVNSDLKTVYESLVKPLNTIIDYNTRFSGITEEQMNRTATSILQVQANILHLCNSNTILIGHSLESDMKALKIIHDNIIDTSVLFPHKFGLPHKRALRELAREFLKKLIQNDINGHDSAEDALTCMELVKWKLKEEMKTRGIKV